MAHRHRSQGGIALLLFLFLLFGLGTTLTLGAWNASAQRAARQQQATQEALRQAKEALIGYTVSHLSNPGRFPCPEILSASSPIEGQATTNCATVARRLGRFPWQTLRTERLVDADGEPLWYAVSETLTKTSGAPKINSTTLAGLQVLPVDSSQVVAVIIAPGGPLSGQDRSPPSATNPPLAAAYLDLTNAAGLSFISTGASTSFNDRLITITSADLIPALNRRVLSELRGIGNLSGLRRYYYDQSIAAPPPSFPWADSSGSPDGYADANLATGKLPYQELIFSTQTLAWLSANDWFQLVAYTRPSSNSTQIMLGEQILKVLPCDSSSCP